MAPVVVIGAGPGIGGAVARRFARQGLPVALIARSTTSVQAVAAALGTSSLPPLCLTADSADETALRGALDAVTATLGVPEAVVYNAAIIQRDSPGDLPVSGHLRAWGVNVIGALTAAAHILPAMAHAAGGSFIVTGGMPEPDPRYTSLSLGKAGVRALVSLLDKQYGPDGVHVATVTVAGPVAPGTAFDPDDIAEHYWRLHTQPRGHWQLEITHR
jgi:NAD(P)-dependent dehydrogenase (short-subunit alcohol dehydrogenase family)